jgi:hypothetical protein
LSQAQNPPKPAVPEGADASGTVIVPPVTDPGMTKPAPPNADMPVVKPPPAEVDPGEVRKLQQERINGAAKGRMEDGSGKQNRQRRPDPGAAGPSGEGEIPVPGAGRQTRDAECKGAAELCKQDPAR